MRLPTFLLILFPLWSSCLAFSGWQDWEKQGQLSTPFSEKTLNILDCCITVWKNLIIHSIEQQTLGLEKSHLYLSSSIFLTDIQAVHWHHVPREPCTLVTVISCFVLSGLCVGLCTCTVHPTRTSPNLRCPIPPRDVMQQSHLASSPAEDFGT